MCACWLGWARLAQWLAGWLALSLSLLLMPRSLLIPQSLLYSDSPVSTFLSFPSRVTPNLLPFHSLLILPPSSYNHIYPSFLSPYLSPISFPSPSHFTPPPIFSHTRIPANHNFKTNSPLPGTKTKCITKLRRTRLHPNYDVCTAHT